MNLSRNIKLQSLLRGRHSFVFRHGALAISLMGALHAGISVHGSSTTYQETGGGWLSMGINDIDGSGGLGTDGFFFFGNFNGAQRNGQQFSFHVKSTPSYVSGFAQGANWNSAADEYTGYGEIDNPIDLNGSNDRGGFGFSTTGGAGTNNEIMTFTVSSLPAGATVRVGILAGLEANNDGRWDPTSITLSEGANTATVGNHSSSPLPANPGGGNTGWAFFDIDSNGTYRVSATKRVSGQGSGVGGLTFDSLTETIDITDPTDTEPDGMGDNWEIFYFGDLSRDGALDFDNDGRTDAQEWGDGTNPTAADIDGDGLNDGQEHALGTDPLEADSDNDGFDDGAELAAGTDPNSDASSPTLAIAPPCYPALPLVKRDSVVVFNEIHYHPAGDDSSLEYIELYNQMSVDVDLSNWKITGDVEFDFPEGTVLSTGGYLVIAQDPGALATATGYGDALGPFTGLLSNSGGQLRLYNNNRSFRTLQGGVGSPGEIRNDLEGRRVMDEITFTDVAPWQVGPDGSGSTLAKRDPVTGTANPSHWASSVPFNGTPGSINATALKPSLGFNELSAALDPNFRVELVNYGTTSISLDGMIVVSSSPLHADYVFSGGTLAVGSYLSVDAATLGFTPEDNNRLLLYGPGRLAFIDAVRVDDRSLARDFDGTGRWLHPDVETFGATNSFDIEDAIVINEIFYHGYPEQEPFAEREEEWLELYNRSASSVDLTGWKIDGGISFDFPFGTTLPAGGYLVVAKDVAALSAKYSGITIIGNYSGRLGNGGDLIVLEDGNGNPADEVQYFDSGKWHAAADGGGSSLELRDPSADNAKASAWAASDESSRSDWQTYTYEGVAEDDGFGDDLWHELQLGLLAAGEFLLDDVSVIENGITEFIQNGDFDSDTVGGTADKWRAIGTHGSHGQTMVVTDPDDGGNQCLHVVSTGPTENKHNKVESTFANSEEVVVGNTYRIQFRVKWLSGSNQLNSRLYFNFLQRTTLIEVPDLWGTPGAVNSVRVSNSGPTLSGLTHSPVVPNAGEATTVSLNAFDVDGIDQLTLFYSRNGGALQSVGMSLSADGRYQGVIPGQIASSIMGFYVQGQDDSGGVSVFPAQGASGGAFYKVQDGLAHIQGIRKNLRIIMSEADRQFLFLNTNRMSNDRFSVTVIENESAVYYDVGARLKASGHGRFQANGYGFNLRFQPDNLFRGVHSSVSLERTSNRNELLAKHLLNRAGGGYWSFYDDVAHLMPPTTSDTGTCLVSMARHTGNYFDGLFPDSDGSGTLFNLELHYNPTTTTGGPENLKIGNPFTHDFGQYDFADYGSDKETYRWGFQIRSDRDRDDYSKIVALNQAFDLTGAAFKAAMDELIDVDQWMRTFAMLSLNGNDDTFGRIWEHNIRFYVRPTDGKIIALLWDLDRAFRLGTSGSLTSGLQSAFPSTQDARATRSAGIWSIAQLYEIPQYRRLFEGHLEDLVETTTNSSYLSPWSSHLGSVVGANFSQELTYLTNRSNFVLGSVPSEIPFVITANGGADQSVASTTVTLTGDAWVDVFSIEVNGVLTPITWTDAETWSIVVPIQIGENPLTITALNNRGTEIGSDFITVTNTGGVSLADASNTIISELHYHPADPSAAEIAAGFTDADAFEFVEIANIDPTNDVDLINVSFTDGVIFTFPSGTILGPGERVLVVSNQDAFEFRYGAGIGVIAGTYTGNFRNSGEHVRLEAADDLAIADFTYGDEGEWPLSADGAGYSLVFSGGDPAHGPDWRSSVGLGGNPGGTDSVSFGGGDLLAYSLAATPRGQISGDSFLLNVRVNLGADAASLQAYFSTDLVNWVPAPVTDLVSRTNNGDGTETFLFQSSFPLNITPKQFGRVELELR
ncbi:lamin tail domain-containing protein [Akkermansiaceae bacterium]|nr:lamin tail domain-containing protein [Akkermansiaceae bacterium]